MLGVVLLHGVQKSLFFLQESASSFNKLLMTLSLVDSLLIVFYIMDSAIITAFTECEPTW